MNKHISDTVLNVGYNVLNVGLVPCSHDLLSCDYWDLICCFSYNNPRSQKFSPLSPTISIYFSNNI